MVVVVRSFAHDRHVHTPSTLRLFLLLLLKLLLLCWDQAFLLLFFCLPPLAQHADKQTTKQTTKQTNTHTHTHNPTHTHTHTHTHSLSSFNAAKNDVVDAWCVWMVCCLFVGLLDRFLGDLFCLLDFCVDVVDVGVVVGLLLLVCCLLVRLFFVW